MKKTIFLMAAALFSSVTFAQSKNFLDTPYLETQAKVDTLVTPDRIYLNIIIQEKDTKGRVSVEEQENQMAQRFKAMGIDLTEQLVIKDMGSNFKKYFLRQKEVLKSKQYSLLVYSGKELGDVMMALEQLDIANTHIEKTAFSRALSQQNIFDVLLQFTAKPLKYGNGKPHFISMFGPYS